MAGSSQRKCSRFQLDWLFCWRLAAGRQCWTCGALARYVMLKRIQDKITLQVNHCRAKKVCWTKNLRVLLTIFPFLSRCLCCLVRKSVPSACAMRWLLSETCGLKVQLELASASLAAVCWTCLAWTCMHVCVCVCVCVCERHGLNDIMPQNNY